MLLALGLAAFCGDDARGQDLAPNVDIAGVWTLQTKVFQGVCRMTGALTLDPTGAPNEYVGRLEAHQRCVLDDWREDTLAVQSVRAVRDGDHLSIVSTIESVTPGTGPYAPDNFELTIVDGALMSGELHGFNIIPARFERGEAPIA
ncbi:MAG: hypothetical protein PVI23_14605 [Maricaulaceae bacterium]|jgi:hypothetical protein